MSYPHEPQRTSTLFGNPFRRMILKGSTLSPKLLGLLNSFEETLAERIEHIKPRNKDDVLTLSWMRCAIVSLSAIHTDIKHLITALDLPVADWDDKWIDVYLDSSVKLLDLCIAFSSEISRLKQGHLFLQSALHNLSPALLNQLPQGRGRVSSSLDGWKNHIGSKNPRLEKCFSIMDSLGQMLDLPRIKNSSKGKVLMRAMYGVKAVTLFICSIFGAAFCGSSKVLMEMKVAESHLWAKAFTDVQSFINTEIRNQYSSGELRVVKEVEEVKRVVKEWAIDPVEARVLKNYKMDLEGSVEDLGGGLDLLAIEVDSFFQMVLTGRDALLCNLSRGLDKVPSDRLRGQS